MPDSKGTREDSDSRPPAWLFRIEESISWRKFGPESGQKGSLHKTSSLRRGRRDIGGGPEGGGGEMVRRIKWVRIRKLLFNKPEWAKRWIP